MRPPAPHEARFERGTDVPGTGRVPGGDPALLSVSRSAIAPNGLTVATRRQRRRRASPNPCRGSQP